MAEETPQLKQAIVLRSLADGVRLLADHVERGTQLPAEFAAVVEDLEDLMAYAQVLADPDESRTPHAEIVARFG